MLNILSSLSAPLTICSGGACNSIYISTVTSILSSFSIPLTLAVPLLNLFGYILQLVGLISLYSANKWRSAAFWMYLVAMVCQMISSHQWINWICCGVMILASVLNAKSNQFVYGKNKKLFKQSIVWSMAYWSCAIHPLLTSYWSNIYFLFTFSIWEINENWPK